MKLSRPQPSPCSWTRRSSRVEQRDHRWLVDGQGQWVEVGSQAETLRAQLQAERDGESAN